MPSLTFRSIGLLEKSVPFERYDTVPGIALLPLNSWATISFVGSDEQLNVGTNGSILFINVKAPPKVCRSASSSAYDMIITCSG